uniref:Methyltransferase type 11 domain-containing protein n=1 Tax=Emiliania huxleyi TaxID=2903 RepID=A0A7S3RQP4_EMIHU
MRLSRLLWTLPLAPPPLRLRSPCMAGNKYGRKDYWDDLYRGSGSDGLPAEAFSWYCGWSELEPFWSELVASGTPRVLVPGMGNDRSLVELYDAGWRDVTAFDYSEDAVTRARALVGRRDVRLLCADATALPFADASFDAVLDKGTLDAVGIAGDTRLQEAVAELTRTTAAGGVVVTVSRALEPSSLLSAFTGQDWKVERDGGLHVAEGGEVSTDLAAGLFAWRRLPEGPRRESLRAPLPALCSLDDATAVAAQHACTSFASWLVPGRVLVGRYPGSCPSRPCTAAEQRERVPTRARTFVCLQAELPFEHDSVSSTFTATHARLPAGGAASAGGGRRVAARGRRGPIRQRRRAADGTVPAILRRRP